MTEKIRRHPDQREKYEWRHFKRWLKGRCLAVSASIGLPVTIFCYSIIGPVTAAMAAGSIILLTLIAYFAIKRLKRPWR